MKYITTEDRGIVIFSDGFIHSDIARKITGKISGAGFIFIGDNKIECYGESVSLGIKSKEEDSRIAEYHIRKS